MVSAQKKNEPQQRLRLLTFDTDEGCKRLPRPVNGPFNTYRIFNRRNRLSDKNPSHVTFVTSFWLYWGEETTVFSLFSGWETPFPVARPILWVAPSRAGGPGSGQEYRRALVHRCTQ